jgi:hypothetical protein
LSLVTYQHMDHIILSPCRSRILCLSDTVSWYIYNIIFFTCAFRPWFVPVSYVFVFVTRLCISLGRKYVVHFEYVFHSTSVLLFCGDTFTTSHSCMSGYIDHITLSTEAILRLSEDGSLSLCSSPYSAFTLALPLANLLCFYVILILYFLILSWYLSLYIAWATYYSLHVLGTFTT